MFWRRTLDVGESLRDFVYGFHDGLVTTLAIVVALTAASLENKIIILAGIANILADGLSMSLGGYLSSKSEIEVYKKLKINPKKIAIITFIAFIIAGFISLFPYFLLSAQTALEFSVILSFASSFVVGSLRTLITKKNWFVGGLEMLAVVILAASISYIIGRYISSLTF